MVKPGLPRKYAKMGFKKGWREYKRAKRKRGSTRSRSRSSPSKKKSKGGRKMGKSFLSTQTLMKFVRIGALASPAIAVAVRGDIGMQAKINQIIRTYTGFDMKTSKFRWGELAKGWLPYLGSVLITYGIPKIAGMLRRL